MNDGSPQFDAILDTCLDALLAEEWTLEDCLQQFPDQAADLKPALQMALFTTRLKQPEMSAKNVTALEMRLQGEMLAQQSRRRPVRALLPMSRLVATIVIVFMLIIGAGGGVVAASANAMPGDFLYGLKRLWEAIILALSSLTNATGSTWLHLAEMRLDEVEELARRGIIDEGMLSDLYEASANTLLLVDNGSERQVIAYVTDARVRIIDLPANVTQSTVHMDLVDLLTIDNGLRQPAFTTPPSLLPMLATLPSPPGWSSPTATILQSPTAILTPTLTATATATQPLLSPVAPTTTPTSRVAATATDTAVPTTTPVPTQHPSVTPTFTWTPLPLPALPTSRSSGSQGNGNPGGSSNPPTLVPPTADATVRYRETQANLIPTLTAQATIATEEVQP